MEERLRGVDVNLLLSLHALLEERSLTRAGERMGLSQPAMSGALTRLRRQLDDELLVRAGRAFRLTPRAEELRPLVADAVEASLALLGNRRDFHPATSSRQFTVGMSEYAMTVLAEPLSRSLAEQAPSCTIALEPFDLRPEQLDAQLMRSDLIVGPLRLGPARRTQPVFTDELVCVVARGHPAVRDGALTLDDLRTVPHAFAELAGDRGNRHPLDVELEAKGVMHRTVLVRLTSLLTLPFVVSGTDACAFVPSRLARRCLEVLELQIVATPLDPVVITAAAHWHSRRDKDPAVAWLRRLLHELSTTLEAEPA